MWQGEKHLCFDKVINSLRIFAALIYPAAAFERWAQEYIRSIQAAQPGAIVRRQVGLEVCV